MQLKLQPITSGAAAGKQRIEVRDDRGELRGWVQPTEVDWQPTLGGGTRFIVQQCFEDNYKLQIFGCLQDAFLSLGFDNKEIDRCYFPRGIYNEFAWENARYCPVYSISDKDRLNYLVGRTFRVIEQNGQIKLIFE